MVDRKQKTYEIHVYVSDQVEDCNRGRSILNVVRQYQWWSRKQEEKRLKVGRKENCIKIINLTNIIYYEGHYLLKLIWWKLH